MHDENYRCHLQALAVTTWDTMQNFNQRQNTYSQ
jgi:hypothetical protein